MNYKKQIALALLCFSPTIQANNVYSHTFFSAIPQYKLITNLTMNLLIDQAHNEGRALHKRTVQIALFGGKSNDSAGLRDYFLFGGKQNLLVLEAPTQEGGAGNLEPGSTQDLIASDFNIQTQFGSSASTITMNPQQTYAGAALTFRMPVGKRCWASMELPIIHVKNNLNFTETFTSLPLAPALGGGVGFINPLNNNASIPVATMIQAFQQNGMLYGRIDGAQTTTQLAEINLKAGYDAIDRTDLYFSVYGALSIPTGNKPKGEYMFEAIGGNNHHTGLAGGLYGQLQVHEFARCTAWFDWSMEAEYLIHNTQTRSFDLKNRPWSRFMQVYENESQRLYQQPVGTVVDQRSWGINSFTKKVKVKPGTNGTFNANINLVADEWSGCLGFNTFVRSGESISLAQPWQLGPQLASLPLYGVGNIPGSTEPFRTISVLPNANAQFGSGNVDSIGNYYVQESDLDLNSAAHPTVRATTGYGTVGFYRKTTHPQYFELGSSYEFGPQNTVLKRWNVWTKVQITF